MDWKKIVGTVAPTIATALGGPVAGMAVRAVSEALGLPEGATKDDAALALASATPEQLAALKKADQDFALEMRRLDIDVEKISADDRDSARKREMSLGNAASIGVNAMAFTILCGFFYAVHWVLTGEMPADPNKQMLIGTVVGYVSAKADQVVSYFFGSSSSSARKDKIIAQAPPVAVR